MALTPGGRFVPPASPHGVLTRARLFPRLSVKPVVVLMGMAGSGKSVLVASWLRTEPPPGAVAWLTLDVGDQDPSKLASDLLAALSATGVGPLDAALRDLQAPPIFGDPLALVDAIHEALYDSGVPLTLVIDDLHHLAKSQHALGLIDHLLQWAPSNMRVVLCGRSVLGLRLQRLRLEDRVELLGHRDLAFSRQETADVLLAGGLAVPDATLAALEDATQGWPAGVRLAVLAMKAGSGADVLNSLRQDDGIADYLTTEVLNGLDDELRSFVLVAAIDERVCASLVDALRGRDDSDRMLSRCESEGLFLTRELTAGGEPWYRWHSLFTAHMRIRRWRDDHHSAMALERAACQWWRDVDPAIAVRHALAAGDAEEAGRIVADSWLGLALDGRAATVESLVASVPLHVAHAAELHLALALVAAQRGSVDVGRTELALAAGTADRLESAARARFDVHAAVIDLFIVNDREALAEAVARGRSLLSGLLAGPEVPDRATLAFVQLGVGMGEARLQEDIPAALQLLRSAAETARAAGLQALELAALAETCVPAISEGELDSTARLAEAVLTRARATGWGELRTLAPAHGFLGWLALWRGDARGARDQLDRALSLFLPTDWGLRGLSTSTHAEACLALGDVQGAEADALAGHDLARTGRMPPWWPSLLATLDARILLARGEVARAVDLSRTASPGPDYFLATCYRAAVQLAGGLPRECLETLESFPAHRMFAHAAVFVEALRAQACHETEDATGAHEALERALGNAQRYQLLHPFAIIGPSMLPLLRAHLRRGTAHPELLIAVQDRMGSAGRPAVNAWGDTLTGRERTIVRYLATNLSYAEIARAEFVSVNTIKSHLAHIYRKLGVSSRRGAVQRASALGLL